MQALRKKSPADYVKIDNKLFFSFNMPYKEGYIACFTVI